MNIAEVVESLEHRRSFGVNVRDVNPEIGLSFSKNMEYKTIVFSN